MEKFIVFHFNLLISWGIFSSSLFDIVFISFVIHVVC